MRQRNMFGAFRQYSFGSNLFLGFSGFLHLHKALRWLEGWNKCTHACSHAHIHMQMPVALNRLQCAFTPSLFVQRAALSQRLRMDVSGDPAILTSRGSLEEGEHTQRDNDNRVKEGKQTVMRAGGP